MAPRTSIELLRTAFIAIGPAERLGYGLQNRIQRLLHHIPHHASTCDRRWPSPHRRNVLTNEHIQRPVSRMLDACKLLNAAKIGNIVHGTLLFDSQFAACGSCTAPVRLLSRGSVGNPESSPCPNVGRPV
jgi:hypothetical protein